MPAAPLDDEEYRRRRQDAEQAFKSAGVQTFAELFNWACFAAEQAAQLAVKGLLHGIGRGPWGHDLDKLAKQMLTAGIEAPEQVSQGAVFLTQSGLRQRVLRWVKMASWQSQG